jgi:hypothetical protein
MGSFEAAETLWIKGFQTEPCPVPPLTIPYYLSPGWLRIDPTFAPLKGNPRFERPVARK